MKELKAYLLTITAAIAFGIQPFLASYVFRAGVGSTMLALLRVLCMVPVFAELTLIRKESFRIRAKQALKILLLALTGAVLTTILLFRSFSLIDTGTATTLNFCYPIFVLVLGVVFYLEKVSRRTLLSFFLCFAGILMFCNPKGNFTWSGFAMALLSGLTYGIYVLYLEKSRIMDELGFYSFSFYFFAFSSLLLIPITWLGGELSFRISLRGWLLVLLFALDGGILATAFLQAGVREIGSRKASIISALEPVTSIVIGALFMEESISPAKIAGIILVLASTIVIVTGEQRKDIPA